MNKYNDWSRVLIEPMSVNDARLFSLESRLFEEEEMRVKEYEYLRDMMKKLLYSLEQVNMQNLDNKNLQTSKALATLTSEKFTKTGLNGGQGSS